MHEKRARISPSILTLVLACLLSPLLEVYANPADSAHGSRFIVRLADPPLATYRGGIQGYAPTSLEATGERRLDLKSAPAKRYLDYLNAKQAAFAAELHRALPQAEIIYHYRLLLNGVAVQLPQGAKALETLRRLPGVIGVAPERTYRLTLTYSAPLIGAPALWEALGGIDRAGEGIKVAVIDTGIRNDNPFFAPAGFSYPPGFPKGDTRYTTPKIIVARAYFRPGDPPADGEPPTPIDNHGHGSHVAGIVAGVARTPSFEGPISGVAPRAWLMNYKIFYRARSGGSPVAYTPEILASMEDALADGADVVNGSWGGAADFAPDFDPTVLAAEALAEAGVVAVFAAGNEGPHVGTVNAPAIAPHALAVGASTTDRWGNTPDQLWSGSSRGPALGVGLKPDLVAPGVHIYSAFGSYFAFLTGTSMAAPHVAGAAALLRQLHPSWTPAQIKSVLMNTAMPNVKEGNATAGILAQGAGRLDLGQAVSAGLLLSPPSCNLGEIRAGAVVSATIAAYSVGATGFFSLTAEGPPAPSGITLTISPAQLPVPAPNAEITFTLRLEAGPQAAAGDYGGCVWLSQGERRYQLPWWARIVPAEPRADILLLDDDASSLGGGADYLPYYAHLLQGMGLSYEIWDMGMKWQESQGRDRGAMPTAAELKAYRAIIWFTGDSRRTYNDIGARLGDRAHMLQYLRSGGRLLATGQGFSGYMKGGKDPAHLMDIGLGAQLAAEDAYAPAEHPSPFVAAEGVHTAPAFRGMRFDLGGSREMTPTLSTGAGNAHAVDELAPLPEYDSRIILRALLPGATRDGAVGLARSSDPTLEQPQPAMPPGRAVYLSFGLESIHDDTGYTTREELLRRILEWLEDELTVGISNGTAENPYDLVTLTAAMTSTIANNEAIRYRWDLGDGSPVVETVWPSVAYAYRRPGIYHPRVEVMDRLGHTAISAPGTVRVGAAPTPSQTATPTATPTAVHGCHLPLIIRQPSARSAP